jgi:hypothetical protein
MDITDVQDIMVVPAVLAVPVQQIFQRINLPSRHF